MLAGNGMLAKIDRVIGKNEGLFSPNLIGTMDDDIIGLVGGSSVGSDILSDECLECTVTLQDWG
jgi:hypothetical protein